MNLCILLHQLDDPNQHEVVKKAVRKAVKARVKQLGMKYDNEVNNALHVAAACLFTDIM
jgi:hypothetical protein